MNRIRSLLGLISISLLWACTDKDEVPFLELIHTSYSVDAKGGTLVLDITSNTSWMIDGVVNWCEPALQSGNGDAEVEILVQANDSEQSREGVLLLKGQDMEQKISILQQALVLEVDTSEIKISKTGGTKKIEVASNGVWEIKCDAEWVHWELFEVGDSSAIVTLTIDPAQQNRGTLLHVASGQTDREIKITQAEWHRDGEVRIYREEDAGKPIKLVFMGDGFTEEDLLEGGVYDQVMAQGIEAYFSIEPYRSYRDYFCPYIVYTCSRDRGISTRVGLDYPDKKNTALDLNFIEGDRLIGGDITKIQEYARKVSGLDITTATIAVIGNDERYGGKSYLFPSGQGIALLLRHSSFKNILIHEAGGHGFGLLTDEYVDWTIGGKQVTPHSIEVLNNSYQYGMNLNVTAYRDAETVFWKDFIGRPGYEKVGFVEGGYYYQKGIWRSEMYCCMLSQAHPYFCIGCRLAIVKRLKAMAGEEFDLDDFIARDIQKSYP